MPPPSLSQHAPFGGRFEVEREVGRGGVGVVYRAFDRERREWVALKLIGVQGVDASEEARFTREGKTLEALDHPHIVKLVACGTLDETPYVAMEWLEGEDLSSRHRRAPLGLRDALEVARQIAVALDTAHRAGVVHRDIKPSNIFLLGQPAGPNAIFAKLVDFGVALEDDVRLTRTGVVVGTPAYMAPEQARAEGAVDARVDIYSLGASLFELVAGRPPHVGPTAIATLARLVTTDAPRLSELVPLVPPALDLLVSQMLATAPSRRPSGALEVAVTLAQLLEDEGTTDLPLPRSSPADHLTVAIGGTRLFTSIVALCMGSGEERAKVVEQLRSRGADAVALGQDAIVAHVGARRSLGGEAARALELGRYLADRGGKVGVATGRSKVDLTRPVGEVVDRAAGLAHSADPAQLLADTTTTELARGRFEFQVRGDGSAVVGAAHKGKRGEGAGGAPFFGRTVELAQIMAAYERCVEDSTPVVVTVSGAPGIGKSRLGREVLARIAAHATPPKIVVVRSESFGRGHPLGLAADVLRSLLGVSKGTTLELVRGALHALPAPLDGAKKPLTNEARELLARLVANESLPDGDDAGGARDELWVAMTDFVVQMASREPSVLVLEDLQWADEDSIVWIEHLLGRAVGQTLCILALVRPEFFRTASEGTARFLGRDHVKVDLRPISRRAARAIATAILGEGAAEAALDRIASQSGGSPLFAEELARLTALGRDTDSAPTIEAAIQVSLDALDEICRDTIVRLAVFGLSGWDDGLAALGVALPEPALKQLAAADLVVEQAESRLAGAREWAFKHALVRDVAYASLGEGQKKILHAMAGAWLAKMGEDAATVAKHFETGDRPAEAAAYWEKAARRALSTNALSEAVRMAELALAQAEGKPTTFARALLLDDAWSRLDPRAADRETAVIALEDSVFDDASRVRADGARARYDNARGRGASDIVLRLSEARAKAKELGLSDEEARSTATLASRHAFGGNLEAAEREAGYLLELAGARGIPAAAIDAWQVLAVVHQTRGELASALDARKNARRAASQAGRMEREAMLSMNVGFALCTIGAREEARESIEAGLAIAHAIGSVGAIRHGRMNLLGWTATFGADAALEPELADPRADADAASNGLWVTPDRATLGVLFYRACEWLASADAKGPENARKLLKITTEAYRSTGNRDIVPVALGLWSEAERRSGDLTKARSLAGEAATLLEQGAPSLLNESPVFLALHDVELEAGYLPGARAAVERGMALLRRRLRGLKGTPYARVFLSDLVYNERLLRRAKEYGVVPPEVSAVLD
jgi:hypothetical protein